MPRRLKPPSKLWSSSAKWLYGVLALFALLVTLLEGYPWLSIEDGPILDPRNSLSELFNVKNGGYVPVTDLDVSCWLPTSAFGDAMYIDRSAATFHTFSDFLSHDGRATIPCFRTFAGSVRFAEDQALIIEISYNFYPVTAKRLRRKQKFIFQAVHDIQGYQHWVFH